MKKLSILPLLVLSLYSCNNEDEREFWRDQQTQNQSLNFSVKALYSQNHRVSMKDAENQLKDILNSSNNGLKSTSNKTIKQTKVVIRKRGLKSTCGDTLAYVFNFADKGFAICSADDRTPETVLAIVDNGSYEDGEESRNSNYAFISNKIEDYIDYSINDFDANKERYLSIVNSLGGAPLCQLKAAQTKILGTQEPLLNTEWDQGLPYNADLDNCGSYNNNGCNKNVMVGCGALALAQVLHYWETGRERSFLDLEFSGTSRYIANISKAVNTYYGCAQNGHKASGTNDSRLQDYLDDSDIKYDYLYKKADFSFEKVRSMLDLKLPLIITALSDEGYGHAWVIDGYQYFKVTASIITTTCKLVHCNWGWGGYCNGYFSYDLLNPTKGVIYDNNKHDKNNNLNFNEISGIFVINFDGDNKIRLYVGANSESDEAIDTYDNFDKIDVRGLLGCAYKNKVSGTYPFCRYKNNTTGKYVYCIEKSQNADGTMNLRNCYSFTSKGYTLVKRLGYVYDNVGDGRTPICEYRNNSDDSYHGVSYAYDKYILSKNTYMLNYFAALCRVMY